MICEGRTVAEIVRAGERWSDRLAYMQPKCIVELGTGQGASGARIMEALAPDALFTTINYADGHAFGEQLGPWSGDPRLCRISADSLDPATLEMVPYYVDLLFIDTTHEAWHAAEELRLWQLKLQDGAIVVVDDLDQSDMAAFWSSVPYEKVPLVATAGQGVFRYMVGVMRHYEGRFDRPDKTGYHGAR